MINEIDWKKHEKINSLNGRVGVYGFAKSYCQDKSKKKNEIPTYFFRGELKDLAVGNEALEYSCDASSLSDELELVWIIKVNKKNDFSFLGISFGNDLTDLNTFRADQSKILIAKKPRASLCSRWWPCLFPPVSIPVSVKRIRGNSVESYEASLGDGHFVLNYNEAIEIISGMPGANNFNFLVIYTGAPRGFLWKENPLKDGDEIILSLDDLGDVLKNKITHEAI